MIPNEQEKIFQKKSRFHLFSPLSFSFCLQIFSSSSPSLAESFLTLVRFSNWCFIMYWFILEKQFSSANAAYHSTITFILLEYFRFCFLCEKKEIGSVFCILYSKSANIIQLGPGEIHQENKRNDGTFVFISYHSEYTGWRKKELVLFNLVNKKIDSWQLN